MKSATYNPFTKAHTPWDNQDTEEMDVILKNKQDSLNHTKFVNYITHALHSVPAKKILFKMRRT